MTKKMWDSTRVWDALDRTFNVVGRHFRHEPNRTASIEYVPARISPDFLPDLTHESSVKTRRHLLWMREEIRQLAGAGDLEKAQRWLGFVQGAVWAMGMTGTDALRDANREQDTVAEDYTAYALTSKPEENGPPRHEFKTDEFVQCIDKGDRIFRIAKTSEGSSEFTGIAYLVTLNGAKGEEGWRDFSHLRLVTDPKKIEASRLRAKALELRDDADGPWGRGSRGLSSSMHDRARELEDQARKIEST